MKYNVDSQSLMKAIVWNLQAGRKDCSIILSVNPNNTIVLRGENESGMRMAKIDASSDNPVTKTFSFAIAAEQLNKVQNALNQKKADDKVSLTFKDNSIIFSYNNLKLPVNLTVAPNSITTDNETFTNIGSINCKELFENLLITSKIVNQSTSVASSNSLIDMTFDYDSKKAMMRATDRFVIVYNDIYFTPSEDKHDSESSHFLLPPSVANVKIDSDVAFLSESEQSLKIEFDNNFTATFRKQTANFISYDALREQFNKKRVLNESYFTVGAKKLDISSNIIAMYSDDSTAEHNVTFNVKDNMLYVRNNDNTTSDELPIESSNLNNISISLPQDELKKAISSVMSKSDILKVSYVDDKSPVIFEAIMPDKSVSENIYVICSVIKK